MREPHELNDRPGDADAAFEARLLRNVRLIAPRLDRDRLMYLAGRKSVAPASRSRAWQFAAVASWAACAVLAGFLVTRPPQVVVETRVVERVVEKPVAGQITPPKRVDPPAVADSRPPREPAAIDGDLWSLGSGDEPLTILSSRPSFRRPAEALTLAQAPAASADVPRSPPPSYGDLRRELLPSGPEEPASAGMFRWF